MGLGELRGRAGFGARGEAGPGLRGLDPGLRCGRGGSRCGRERGAGTALRGLTGPV